MAEISPRTTWKLAKALRGKRSKPTRNDGVAVVTRVDRDGTRWIRMPGASMDTPVNGEMVASAAVGESVSYRVEDGRLSIMGNASDPAMGVAAVNATVEPVARAAALAQQAGTAAGDAAKAARMIAEAIGQHFWHDDNGAHISTEAGNPTGSRNALWNSLGMLFRAGTSNLLALVTGDDPGMDVYDGQGNAAGNIIAAFHGSGARIGRSGENNVIVTPHYFAALKGSLEVFKVGRQLDSDGYMEYKETFAVTTATSSFTLEYAGETIKGFEYDGETEEVTIDPLTVTVDGTELASTEYELEYLFTDVTGTYVGIRLYSAATAGQVVQVTYRTSGPAANSMKLGVDSRATGDDSSAFGSSLASGDYSHAEGTGSEAIGVGSHAEGGRWLHDTPGYFFEEGGTAIGGASHAEGVMTKAIGSASHAQNVGTVTASEAQTAIGKYNANNPDNAFEIGNGADDANRSNAITVDWDGIIGAGRSESDITLGSDVSGASLNKIWTNGVTCTVSFNVRNDAAIASAGNITVGTVPEGFRPPYGVYAACGASRTAGMGCYASIATSGAVHIYNRSGASVTAGTALAATITYAL